MAFFSAAPKHRNLLQILFGLLAICGAVGCLTAQTAVDPWPEVVPGIEYIHQRIGSQPWSVHAVKIDRSVDSFYFLSTLAQGQIKGLAPLTRQIESIPQSCGKPLAAINADFFRIQPGPYQGDPTGLQIVQGELVSDPGDTSLWFDPNGRPHIAPVVSNFQCTAPDQKTFPFRLNQERAENAAVLFTPAFGPSTCTAAGTELILEKTPAGPWLPLQVGMQFQAQIRTISPAGDTAIEPDTLVLSLGPGMLASLPDFQPGMTLSFSLQTQPDLTGVPTALGGHPILLQNGKMPGGLDEKSRHPRSAFGWNDQFFFLVVVDGRQKGLSIGMTFPELARLMQQFGCNEAVNLDGGGSSTLWLGGKILNSPSDGRQRSIANGLILMQKVNPNPEK